MEIKPKNLKQTLKENIFVSALFHTCGRDGLTSLPVMPLIVIVNTVNTDFIHLYYVVFVCSASGEQIVDLTEEEEQMPRIQREGIARALVPLFSYFHLWL